MKKLEKENTELENKIENEDEEDSDPFKMTSSNKELLLKDNKFDIKDIKELNLDEAIISSGDFNKYQILNLIYLSLVWILIPTIPVMLPYFRMIPEYYVATESNTQLGNSFFNNTLNSNGIENNLRKANLIEICDANIPKIKADKLVTWASDFDLICNKNYYFGIMGSLYFIGILLGNLFISHFTDKYGRKKVIIFLLFAYLATTFLTLIAWNYFILFLVIFLIGIIYAGTSMCTFILNFESSSKTKKKTFSVILSTTYGLGAIFHILVFYYFQNWKMSIFICSILTVFSIYSVSTINESPEYLFEKKKYSKLKQVLFNIAQINQREKFLLKYLSETNLDNLIKAKRQKRLESKSGNLNGEELEEQMELDASTLSDKLLNQAYGILDILNLKEQRFVILLMSLNWFFMTMIFYGLNLNISFFKTDPYVTGVLIYLSESIAQLTSLYFMESFGYKNTLIGAYIISSVAFIIIDLIDLSNNYFLGLLLIFISKFGISAVVSTNYTFTADLFDMKIRVASMSFCSVMSRLGGVSGTLIIEITKYAMLTFGSLCFLSSFIILKVEKVEQPKSVYEEENYVNEENDDYKKL